MITTFMQDTQKIHYRTDLLIPIIIVIIVIIIILIILLLIIIVY